MPIRFIARLSNIDKNNIGFYVPKYVKEFYGLKPGLYKGGISSTHGEVTSSSIKLKKYKKTLTGVLKKNIGEPGKISEVWIYRDTWTPPKTPVKKP